MPLARDFYPRPPRGGRLSPMTTYPAQPIFLSTPSARRATFVAWSLGNARTYFYPRPPRGGRPRVPLAKYRSQLEFLSTPSARRATGQAKCVGCPHIGHFYPRPPRGGRPGEVAVLLGGQVISIHALREEGDVCGAHQRWAPRAFLSTPSARRATCPPLKGRQAWEFLSTPSARRATVGGARNLAPF